MRSRRQLRFWMWWCRFWGVFGAAWLVLAVVQRDVWWAALDMVLVVLFLYQADQYRQKAAGTP